MEQESKCRVFGCKEEIACANCHKCQKHHEEDIENEA